MQMKFPWLHESARRLYSLRAGVPHALLLTGQSGIGLGELAELFAASLLCEAPLENGAACGKCPACGWTAQGTHPDLRRLSPAAASADDPDAGEVVETRSKSKPSRWIKIDQVRALGDFLTVGGHRGGYKLVLIDPAEALNVPAANALLKTLEEPPGRTVLVLVSSRPDTLLPTIRSRCVVMPVHLPDPQMLVEWLMADAGIDQAQAVSLLAAAGGSPLRARELADPGQAAAYRSVLKYVAEMPDISIIQAAEALASTAPGSWVPVLQAWVTDLGRVAAGAQPRRFPDHGQRLQRLAKTTTLARIGHYGQWLQRQTAVLEHPLSPKLFCEDMMLRYGQVFLRHEGDGHGISNHQRD